MKSQIRNFMKIRQTKVALFQPDKMDGRTGATSLKVNFRSRFSNMPKHLHRIYNKDITTISDSCLKQFFSMKNA